MPKLIAYHKNKNNKIFFTCTIAFALCLVFCVALKTNAQPIQEGGAAPQPASALTNLISVLYNDKNGLPTGEANAVVQTTDGYLWIGSYGGLIRYDGKEFYNFSVAKEGLQSFGIRALYEDNAKRLLVGTNDKGVFIYENGKFQPCGQEANRFQSIRCITQSADGSIYIGTATGLALLTADHQLEPVPVPQLQDQAVLSLAVDKNDVVWGIGGKGEAFALKGGQLIYWFEPGELCESDYGAVAADGEHIFLGTSGRELVRLTLQDTLYQDTSYKTEVFDTGAITTVNALCVTKNKNLWLGSHTGIAWFDVDMQLHQPSMLERYKFINNIIEDYEGNLWLSSNKSGVFLLTQGKFLSANQKAGLDGKIVNATAWLGGQLYVATESGLVIVDEAWNPVQNRLTELLAGKRVRQVYADAQGYLWISTYSDYGLVGYEAATQKTRFFTEKEGMLSNRIRMVYQLKNKDIAVATTQGINLLRGAKVIKGYGQSQDMPNPVVLCFLEAADGSLLAGSDGNGIYKIKGGAIQQIGRESGLASGVVLRMCADPARRGVWLGVGSDLYFMDDKGQARKLQNFHQGVGSVFDLQIIGETLWVFKSNGLMTASADALLQGKEVAVTTYGQESGLSASLTPNAWNGLQSGVFYVCTTNGLSLLDTAHMYTNKIAPKTIIKGIVGEDENGKVTLYQSINQLQLPPTTRRLTIRLACLSYTTELATISYYLKGFDNQPIVLSAGDIDVVSYTNLAGGKYEFCLTAHNADGVGGQITSLLQIEKELTWLEQPFFWVGAILALLGISAFSVWLFMYWKMRRLRKRQQEYKAITEQSLRTIANTIDAKDAYTNGHSVRVAEYSKKLAGLLALSTEEQDNIYYMALLHDIGKIGIPDAILNKPDKLTDEEFAMMRNHTQIGADILKDFTVLPQIGQGALYHHERCDGKGYPENKAGVDIPVVAQIIGAADAYDAMATRRSYKEPMTKEQMIEQFEKGSGHHFEAHIAQLMIRLIAENQLANGAETQ